MALDDTTLEKITANLDAYIKFGLCPNLENASYEQIGKVVNCFSGKLEKAAIEILNYAANLRNIKAQAEKIPPTPCPSTMTNPNHGTPACFTYTAPHSTTMPKREATVDEIYSIQREIYAIDPSSKQLKTLQPYSNFNQHGNPLRSTEEIEHIEKLKSEGYNYDPNSGRPLRSPEEIKRVLTEKTAERYTKILP